MLRAGKGWLFKVDGGVARKCVKVQTCALQLLISKSVRLLSVSRTESEDSIWFSKVKFAH